MCTAISYENGAHYFGRNLDLEQCFIEAVTVTPKYYPFPFRFLPTMNTHFAMIGMAAVVDDYPLYYEATNECGLSVAALNFPGNAVYFSLDHQKINLAPYELIPWLLGQYATVDEARKDLKNINITDIAFSDQLPLSPLHWMLSDKQHSIVLESTINGLQIYDNPVNVLTNNPPFPFHLQYLSNFMNISADEAVNRFAPDLNLQAYSRGMGGLGLPGDHSSSSRFVRAAFGLHNSIAADTEDENISQFFHILESVAQVSGCVKIGSLYEKTIYSCCCNTQKGIYYYKTYENSEITAIRLFSCDLEQNRIVSFPLRKQLSIYSEN